MPSLRAVLAVGFNSMKNVFNMILCERDLIVNMQSDLNYVKKMYTKY